MFRPQVQPQRAVNNRQLAQLPEVSEVGTLVVNAAKQFAVRHKYVTAWYLFGIAIIGGLMLSGGGHALTPQQSAQYESIMNSIDLQAEYDAVDAYWAANNRYRATKGWFWSCDGACQRNKHQMNTAEKRLNEVRAEGNARMSDAKAVAGLYSDVAVNEMTDSFWQYLAAGKRFAKRQTGWDIMWMMMRGIARGRDESWAEYALKILLHVLINFSMGLLSALLFFVLGLWNILRSYQPNPVVAVLVFLSAAAAASSFVLTYLLGLFGAAAGGVYGLAKLAEHTARAQLRDDQRRERLQRPHYN